MEMLRLSSVLSTVALICPPPPSENTDEIERNKEGNRERMKGRKELNEEEEGKCDEYPVKLGMKIDNFLDETRWDTGAVRFNLWNSI
jgi:hypothetical protein